MGRTADHPEAHPGLSCEDSESEIVRKHGRDWSRSSHPESQSELTLSDRFLNAALDSSSRWIQTCIDIRNAQLLHSSEATGGIEVSNEE